MINWNQEARIDVLSDAIFEENQVSVSVLREDLLHPTISGNKIRKLKYFYLELESNKEKNGFFSFGGSYSNHLHALSYLGKITGIETLGFVRGESSDLEQNPTLSDMQTNLMKLNFLSRTEYSQKSDAEFIARIEDKHPHLMHIPEGASHHLGYLGCKHILHKACDAYDFVCVSMGTGTTVAGVLDSVNNNQKCITVTSFKNHYQQLDFIKQHSENIPALEVHRTLDNTRFGDFSPELIAFINNFSAKYNILLDPIYNAKLFYTIFGFIERKFFPKGTKILLIHTGGLQGIRGANQIITKRKWKEKIEY